MAIDWKNIDWLKTYKERIEIVDTDILKEYKKGKKRNGIKIRSLCEEKLRLEKLVKEMEESENVKNRVNSKN